MEQVANVSTCIAGVSIQGLCQGQTQVGRGRSIAPPPPQEVIHVWEPVPAHRHFPSVLFHPAIAGRVPVRAMLQHEEALRAAEEPITSPAHCP